MSTHLTGFLFEKEYPFRSMDQDGELWFVLGDVCRILGLRNPSQVALRLDDDEKTTIDPLTFSEGTDGCDHGREKGVGISDALGGGQELLIVSESGLYLLMMRSHGATTPGTLVYRFRKWVTAEVLPTIRRTGGYQLPALSFDPQDHRRDDGLGKFPGQRFREERERLGFASAKELVKAIGLPLSQGKAFEELGVVSKRLDHVLALEAVGFDCQYWRSGIRTLTLAERKLLEQHRASTGSGAGVPGLPAPAVPVLPDGDPAATGADGPRRRGGPRS